VEMGEGDCAEFGIGFDGPGVLGEGMGLHGLPPTIWEIPLPHFQMRRAGTGQGWKTGIVGNRRAASAPLPRPAHWACEGMRTRGPHRRIYRLPNRATVVAAVEEVYGRRSGAIRGVNDKFAIG
jgi:hypothetical protein